MNESLVLLECAEKLVAALLQHNLTISTAESCTGGMISAFLTSVPGSSMTFLGGIVAYSNDVKLSILRLSQSTLDRYGAVSHETASEMVIECNRVIPANISVAVTGIAGPTGGTPQKPVGLVYIAVKNGSKIAVEKFNFSGSRDDVRTETTLNAMELVLKTINK